jgi:hypothetical protein
MNLIFSKAFSVFKQRLLVCGIRCLQLQYTTRVERSKVLTLKDERKFNLFSQPRQKEKLLNLMRLVTINKIKLTFRICLNLILYLAAHVSFIIYYNFYF